MTKAYGLVEHNLGLVQFLLDLHDAVGLLGVLVFDNVLFELRQGACVLAQRGIGESCPGMLGEELVDDLGKKLVSHKGRVVAIGHNDTGHALGPAVCVECV